MKFYIKLYGSLLGLILTVFFIGYGTALNHTEISSKNNAVAIAVRMIYAQQCSENFESFFGKSHSSTQMSKEQMQINLVCYELADRISSHISESTQLITDDNVVEIVDKAVGNMKEELKNNQSSDCEDVEPVESNSFI